MDQIYIEWRDAVAKPQHSASDEERPKTTLLRGTVWLVEETEIDLVVAGYVGEDGGFVDLMAIPKTSIEKREVAA